MSNNRNSNNVVRIHSDKELEVPKPKPRLRLSNEQKGVLAIAAGVAAMSGWLLGYDASRQNDPSGEPFKPLVQPPAETDRRFNAFEDHVGDFVTAYIGRVTFMRNVKVYDAPKTEKKYGKAAKTFVRAGYHLQITNPVQFEDTTGDTWMLVDGPKGAGYIEMGHMNDADIIDVPLENMFNFSKKGSTYPRAIRTTYQLEHAMPKPTRMLIKPGPEVLRGENLRFDLKGFTFDYNVYSTKADLIREATHTHLLQLGQQTHPNYTPIGK